MTMTKLSRNFLHLNVPKRTEMELSRRVEALLNHAINGHPLLWHSVAYSESYGPQI